MGYDAQCFSEISVSRLTRKRFSTTYEYWHQACRGDVFPSYENFHLDELPPKTIPYCIVFDCLPIWRYRFFGTAHVSAGGCDLTGAELMGGNEIGCIPAALVAYDMIAGRREPVANQVMIHRESPLLPLYTTTLFLPLSSDSAKIDKLILVSAWSANRGFWENDEPVRSMFYENDGPPWRSREIQAAS